MAGATVEVLARLAQEHLPDDVDVLGQETETLELRLLGQPSVTYGGKPIALAQRQLEILAALALEGDCTLDRLQWLVYGDRPVSPATVKAELSHIRAALGGAVGSRPYRLTMPVVVDAVEVQQHLRSGRVGDAVDAYGGSLLDTSEAPFAVERRHVIDVSLREAVLATGGVDELVRLARTMPDDEEVLEHAIELAEQDDPRRFEALALLDLARR